MNYSEGLIEKEKNNDLIGKYAEHSNSTYIVNDIVVLSKDRASINNYLTYKNDPSKGMVNVSESTFELMLDVTHTTTKLNDLIPLNDCTIL